MQDVSGKVAVVTGAASGIGRGMAEQFCAAGMKVVLADIEADALTSTEQELSSAGHEVLGVTTDVADRSRVDALADAAYERFGAVNVLCNNAGVAGGGGAIWSTTPNDWAWVLGVNLMGVVHGLQAFVPRMIAGGQDGHIVNTSSVLGLSTGGGSIYSVTKHAVARLTEGLWYDLRAADAKISASVLCPGLIATRIASAWRNRPEHLRNDDSGARMGPDAMAAAERRFAENGMPPAEVGAMVLDAIREDRFYILTHPEMILNQTRARFEGILENRLSERAGRLTRAPRTTGRT